MIKCIDHPDDIANFITKSHQLNQSPPNPEIINTLFKIQNDIRTKRISAVLDYTKQFDHVDLTVPQLKVTSEEIAAAHNHVSNELVASLKNAKLNIETFHRHQIPRDWTNSPDTDITYGMRYTPIDRVCLYVPGGRAPYPSTVLMDAIPAKIAGVKQLIITTPPQKDGSITPEILVAAALCGVTDIYKVGGAQAIFAVTYGTDAIPTVDKIVGPGNIYVNLAKQMVYGIVDIDKPAGPSDVLIIVEDPDYAPYAAAEMLAQLEHDPLSIAITLSTQQTVLDQIQSEITAQLPTLSHQDTIKKSIQNSALLLASNQSAIIDYANAIAAEHLVLLVDNHDVFFNKIHHAGAIFCGPYTPVTLGDYYAGPNHVLPTSGTARFASPLSVMDFMKFSTHLHYSKPALKKAKKNLKNLTNMEGFTAHYNAVTQRLT